MLTVTDGSGNGFALNRSIATDVVNAVAGQFNNDVGKALLAVKTFLDGGAVSDAVRAAINGVIADNAALQKIFSNQVVEFLLDKDSQGQPVLRTLGKVSSDQSKDELKYTLDADPTRALQAGDVSLMLSAHGTAGATIDVVHDSGTDAEAPAFAKGDALLKFALSADLNLQGASKAPFNGGSANGTVGVDAQVELEAFTQWPATNTVIGAVVQSVANFCSPWDLDDVDTHLAKINTQGEYRGLRKLLVKKSGSMQLIGSISVGHSWKTDKLGFAGLTDLNATLGIDLGINVGLSRDGNFQIGVQRASDGAIEVDVARSDGTEKDVGFDFSAGLVVTGLAQKVQPIVDQLFPDPSGLIAKLKDWSTPGTKLVQLLQGELPAGNPALTLLGKLLLGTVQADAAQDQVRQLISDFIKEHVDNVIPFWSQIGDAAGLGSQLAGALAQKFGLDANASGPLINALLGPLQNALAALNTQFQTAVGAIATAAGAEFAKVFAPLSVIGADVQALAAAANRATAVIAPVTQLLAKYEDIRNNVTKAVAIANKLKLGLALKAAYKLQTTAKSDLVIRIRNVTAQTRLVYRALMLGRLDHVWGMLQQAVDAGDIEQPTGTFTDTISRDKSLDLSVYFGNKTIDWTQSSNVAVKVIVDAMGTVSLNSEAQFSSKSVMSAFGASSSATFGGTIDIATALTSRQSSLPVTFAFSLEYSDKRMKASELSAYFDSVKKFSGDAALLSSAAMTQLLKNYPGPSNARVDMAVNISPSALRDLFKSAQNDPENVLAVARAALFSAQAMETAPNNLVSLADTTTAKNAADVAKAVAKMLGDCDAHKEQRDVEWVAKTLGVASSGGPSGEAGRIFRDIGAMNQAAKGLLDALNTLADGGRKLSNALAAPGAAGKPTPKEISDRYANALKDINGNVVDDLNRWFIPANWYTQAPRTTVALLATLAKLGNLPAPQLVPIVQIVDDKGNLQRLLAF